ncbi:MAG TPA: hypothetical protein VHE30_24925 [Polyangiaceae bacterium]|nr:hypothetical protein [Polyangiaceae bacterium]
MNPLGRLGALVPLLVLAVGCGGGTLSVLHARGKAKGDGPAQVAVQNSSGVPIERLYVAKAEDVQKAKRNGVAPDTEGDQALWGDDQLGNTGLMAGSTWSGLLTLPADRYDVLVVDHDHREQLVEHVTLKPGGKYVLEIGDDWTQAR